MSNVQFQREEVAYGLIKLTAWELFSIPGQYQEYQAVRQCVISARELKSMSEPEKYISDQRTHLKRLLTMDIREYTKRMQSKQLQKETT